MKRTEDTRTINHGVLIDQKNDKQTEELHWIRKQDPTEENIRKHARCRNQLRKTMKWEKKEQLTKLFRGNQTQSKDTNGSNPIGSADRGEAQKYTWQPNLRGVTCNDSQSLYHSRQEDWI
eukprot:g34339.t1